MGFNDALSKVSEDDFLFMMKNGKRTSKIGEYEFESLIHCSFKFLRKRLPELIKNLNFERIVLEIHLDRGWFIFPCDVDKIDYNSVLSFFFWIKDEIRDIAEMEKNYLATDPNIDMIAAGVNELNKFGDLNTIDALAMRYHISHEEVESWPYSKIFDIQLKMLTEGRIEKKLVENQSKKSRKRGHS